jgi:ABC-type polysaccharide/polyol phosphate export permease
MFGIFFTPVFFKASTFGKWEPLLLLNPIGSILESLSDVVVLHAMPSIPWLLYAAVSSILFFVMGSFIFNKTEPLFAEYI